MAPVSNPANRLPHETALFAYDTLLTVSYESRYIWNKKFRLAATLYLLARYMMLVYLSLQTVAAFLNFTSLQVCLFVFNIYIYIYLT
jgi:Family of unknown function (DUF6533)